MNTASHMRHSYGRMPGRDRAEGSENIVHLIDKVMRVCNSIECV